MSFLGKKSFIYQMKLIEKLSQEFQLTANHEFKNKYKKFMPRSSAMVRA